MAARNPARSDAELLETLQRLVRDPTEGSLEALTDLAMEAGLVAHDAPMGSGLEHRVRIDGSARAERQWRLGDLELSRKLPGRGGKYMRLRVSWIAVEIDYDWAPPGTLPHQTARRPRRTGAKGDWAARNGASLSYGDSPLTLGGSYSVGPRAEVYMNEVEGFSTPEIAQAVAYGRALIVLLMFRDLPTTGSGNPAVVRDALIEAIVDAMPIVVTRNPARSNPPRSSAEVIEAVTRIISDPTAESREAMVDLALEHGLVDHDAPLGTQHERVETTPTWEVEQGWLHCDVDTAAMPETMAGDRQVECQWAALTESASGVDSYTARNFAVVINPRTGAGDTNPFARDILSPISGFSTLDVAAVVAYGRALIVTALAKFDLVAWVNSHMEDGEYRGRSTGITSILRDGMAELLLEHMPRVFAKNPARANPERSLDETIATIAALVRDPEPHGLEALADLAIEAGLVDPTNPRGLVTGQSDGYVTGDDYRFGTLRWQRSAVSMLVVANWSALTEPREGPFAARNEVIIFTPGGGRGTVHPTAPRKAVSHPAIAEVSRLSSIDIAATVAYGRALLVIALAKRTTKRTMMNMATELRDLIGEHMPDPIQRNPSHRRNPSTAPDRDDAISKYKEFTRYDPDKVGDFPASFAIPRRVHCMGDAKWVTYRSDKVDPETLKAPRDPVDYIHEHDPGVKVYVCRGELDTDTPDFLVDCTALVLLGACTGFGFVYKSGAESEAVGERPYPELYTIPSGKALLVVQSKKEILAIMWGGDLGVEGRGIVG